VRPLGPFLIDYANRRLHHGRHEVQLQPKVFELIALLAARPGKLTSVARIREALWPDAVVGDDAVRQIVAKARVALRTSDGAHALTIRARKGLGYVLAGGDEAASADAAGEDFEGPSEHSAMTAGASYDWPFVGRTRERASLSKALAGPFEPGGGLVLVSGEAGAGKTTLLDLTRRERALPPGGLWLTGHCVAETTCPPLWPFRQIGRALARAGDDDAELATAARQLEALWTRDVKELARTPWDRQAEQRLVLAQAVCDRLWEVARARSLVLELEDVHWADAASLLVIELLALHARSEPLRVITTFRSDALPTNPLLAGLIGRVAGRAGVTEVRLRPLSNDDLSALLALKSHPSAANREALESLRHQTGGNALFVRLLLEAPVWPAEGGSSLAHAVLGRLRVLSGKTRAALEQAGVLGEEFQLSTLARTLDWASSDVMGALEPALAAGLLRPGSLPDSLSFAHALVAEVLVEQLPLATRMTLHQRAWRALCDLPAAPLGALAWHAVMAGDELELATRRDLCLKAGREAMQELAFDHAAVHFTRALELAHGLTPAQRAELAFVRAQALWEADAEFGKVTEAFESAAEAARRAGLHRLLAESAIWSAVGPDTPSELHNVRTRQGLTRLLEEAHARLEAEACGERHRVARTLTWMYASGGVKDEAVRWARLALDHLHEGADAWMRLLADGIACTLAIWQEDRAAAHAQLVQLRGHLDDPSFTVRQRIEARLQHLTLCLWLGDLSTYAALALELPALVALLPHPLRFGRFGERLCSYALSPALTRLTLAMIAGDFAGAQARLDDLMAEAAALGFGGLQGGEAGLLIVMPLLRYQKRCRTLAPLVEMSRAALGPLAYHLMSAQIALEDGARDDARRHFDALRADDFSGRFAERRATPTLGQLVDMADVCAEVGTAADARTLYAALRPSRGFFAAEGCAVSYGSCARALAVLAMQLGDLAQAIPLFEEAVTLNEAMGHRPELVRSKLWLASALSAAGHAKRAETLNAEAFSEAENMGLTLDLSRGASAPAQ
jgi:DNA-binding winged helix-turn-helix (wHTH) protein/tetratricopeptide (TPR) repeat protein